MNRKQSVDIAVVFSDKVDDASRKCQSGTFPQMNAHAKNRSLTVLTPYVNYGSAVYAPGVY